MRVSKAVSEAFIGQKFSRFELLDKDAARGSKNRKLWRLRCECGNERIIAPSHVVDGRRKSCGCLPKELNQQRLTKHGKAAYPARPPEYGAWVAMRYRCYTKTASQYKNYGGRGIYVCNRWLNGEDGKHPFECFLADMGLRPSDQHSLDRIDNDGPYSPDNCRWADHGSQATNRRTSHFIEVNGERLTYSQAARMAGLNSSTISRRIKRGMTPEQAVA